MGKELFWSILRMLLICHRFEPWRREILLVVVRHGRAGEGITGEVRTRWCDRHIIGKIRSSRRRALRGAHDRVGGSYGCHGQGERHVSDKATALEVVLNHERCR